MIKKTYYKTKDFCKVKFTVAPENAETVEIRGLFNDWDKPVKMKKLKNGSFTAEVNLPKSSTYEFRYLVDGKLWLNEPDADSEQMNAFGSTNSVLVV
ncbi:MAG: isoamylase early set domain-containing protein [Chitinophagaceae bacterium]|nr:isoamylase early set domain-containing protein [Chitinophagaceae bacterium]